MLPSPLPSVSRRRVADRKRNIIAGISEWYLETYRATDDIHVTQAGARPVSHGEEKRLASESDTRNNAVLANSIPRFLPRSRILYEYV